MIALSDSLIKVSLAAFGVNPIRPRATPLMDTFALLTAVKEDSAALAALRQQGEVDHPRPLEVMGTGLRAETKEFEAYLVP